MTEREFCYWLQGMIEIGGVRPLDEREVQIIADHLALVFSKVTPARTTSLPVTPGMSAPWASTFETQLPPAGLPGSISYC